MNAGATSIFIERRTMGRNQRLLTVWVLPIRITTT